MLGLAIYQVERATTVEQTIDDYHWDKHKLIDQRLLIDRLLASTPMATRQITVLSI